MSETNTAFVYNREGVQARNLMAKVSSDDIGNEQIDCTLRVLVTDAHFVEQRMQSGLHRPYMEIIGQVDEVFIEDGDDRYFPCGTKSMMLDSPQDVRIAYIPSSSELSDLADMGLYYPDFNVPKNLVGNRIEIPHTITYSYVCDTIISMVGINNPYEIETCTRDNQYDGIFLDCDVSKHRAREDAVDFEFTREEPVHGVSGYESVLKDYFEDDIAQHTAVSEHVAVNEPEDRKTIDNFANVLVDADKQIGEKHAAVAATAAAREKIVESVESEAKRKSAEESRKSAFATDPYAQLMSGSGTSDDNTAVKVNYDMFKETMAKLQAKAEALAKAKKANSDDENAEAKDDLDRVNQVDRVADNKALNAGITDIAGFGADESKMTTEQRAAYYAKKSANAVRRADIAADNKALNAGITDIAGFGAATPEKKETPPKRSGAASLRNSLLGKPAVQPSDDGPGYL